MDAILGANADTVLLPTERALVCPLVGCAGGEESIAGRLEQLALPDTGVPRHFVALVG